MLKIILLIPKGSLMKKLALLIIATISCTSALGMDQNKLVGVTGKRELLSNPSYMCSLVYCCAFLADTACCPCGTVGCMCQRPSKESRTDCCYFFSRSYLMNSHIDTCCSIPTHVTSKDGCSLILDCLMQ